MSRFKYLWRAVRQVTKMETYDRLQLHAQALTYDTLLGLVPLLAVGLAVLTSFGGMTQVTRQLQDTILENISGSTAVKEITTGYIQKFVDNVKSGHMDGIALVLLIWSVLGLLSHIDTAINAIFGSDRPRPWATRVMAYWTVLTFGPVLLAASFGLTAYMHTDAGDGMMDRMGWIGQMLFSSLPFLATWLAFTMMYVVVPQVKVRLKSAVIAAFVASILWNGAKWGYAIYAERNFALQNIYGSLATIPLFIVWLFVSWMLVLVGAQLTFALQHAETYALEPNKPLSPEQCELYGSSILLNTVWNFLDGLGPTDPVIIGRLMGLTSFHIEHIVAMLCKGDFICQVENTGRYTPSRDPHDVTPYDVVKSFRTSMSIDVPESTDPAVVRMEVILRDASDVTKSILAQQSFATIVDQLYATPEGQGHRNQPNRAPAADLH